VCVSVCVLLCVCNRVCVVVCVVVSVRLCVCVCVCVHLTVRKTKIKFLSFFFSAKKSSVTNYMHFFVQQKNSRGALIVFIDLSSKNRFFVSFEKSDML
jgi:hypothetical protein